MKKIFLAVFLCFSVLSYAQSYVDIQEERYAELLEEEQQREKEREKWFREQERKTQEKINAINNLKISIPQQSSRQNMQSKSNTTRQNYNKQIAIQQRNNKKRQQNAALMQQQAEARQEEARRRAEERRRREEEERRKREETRQRVTAETYQSLEKQTRSLQAAAAYASGEGAYDLMRRHNVSNFETPIQTGTGNALSQIDHLPRQKFTMPQNGLVIDPDRIYQFSNSSNSEDLAGLVSDEDKLRMQEYNEQLQRMEGSGSYPAVAAEDEEYEYTAWERVKDWTGEKLVQTGKVIEWSKETWQDIKEETVSTVVSTWIPDDVQTMYENAKDITLLHISVFNHTETYILSASKTNSRSEQREQERIWKSGVRDTTAKYSGNIMQNNIGYNPYVSYGENAFNSCKEAGKEAGKEAVQQYINDISDLFFK